MPKEDVSVRTGPITDRRTTAPDLWLRRSFIWVTGNPGVGAVPRWLLGHWSSDDWRARTHSLNLEIRGDWDYYSWTRFEDRTSRVWGRFHLTSDSTHLVMEPRLFSRGARLPPIGTRISMTVDWTNHRLYDALGRRYFQRDNMEHDRYPRE